MEIVKIKCPSCKADIKVAKEGMARCPYCGTGIYAERKDEKLIGFLSSKEKAESIIKELLEKPGFRDCPDGFKIKTMIIGKDYYTRGFKSKCAPKDE